MNEWFYNGLVEAQKNIKLWIAILILFSMVVIQLYQATEYQDMCNEHWMNIIETEPYWQLMEGIAAIRNADMYVSNGEWASTKDSPQYNMLFNSSLVPEYYKRLFHDRNLSKD